MAQVGCWRFFVNFTNDTNSNDFFQITEDEAAKGRDISKYLDAYWFQRSKTNKCSVSLPEVLRRIFEVGTSPAVDGLEQGLESTCDAASVTM